MSKKLEQFIKDNREDFDKYEPGPVVWHNIQQQLNKPKQEKGILISMKTLRWSAAAAIIILLGIGAYFFLNNKKPGQEIAGKNNTTNQSTQKSNNLPVPVNIDTAERKPENSIPEEMNNKKDDAQYAGDYKEYNEELYHYTRLVELKQNEIKKIKKDEPLLYQKFAGDIDKLDSTFHTLQKALPANPNREQILEAMIQNLKLQEALLNQQLDIIKKINHTKKAEYEKAYKSI